MKRSIIYCFVLPDDPELSSPKLVTAVKQFVELVPKRLTPRKLNLENWHLENWYLRLAPRKLAPRKLSSDN